MKEVTYKDWLKNPIPREMWVWDNDKSFKVKRKVIYILNNIDDMDIEFPVIVLDPNEKDTYEFIHCAEIEDPKTRRMTNKEFVLWLLEGIREGKLRQWRWTYSTIIENYPYSYTLGTENSFVENKLIRENGGEWREPLVEVEE